MRKELNRISLAIMATFILAFSFSCKKELKQLVDCLAEESLTSVNPSIDNGNSKVYTFRVSYGGTHTLATVKWKFGDGTEATTTGTESVTHTYKEGTFHLTAIATVRNNDESCDMKLAKTIVVN